MQIANTALPRHVREERTCVAVVAVAVIAAVAVVVAVVGADAGADVRVKGWS